MVHQVPPHLHQIIQEQQDLVLAIEDPDVIKNAKLIAYYTAMLNAALNSPLDDPHDQESVELFLHAQIVVALEIYQSLINEHL